MTRLPRVLILHDLGRRIGGAEHLSLLLRDSLRARGHESQLLSSTADVMRRDVPLPVEADATFFGTQGAGHRLLRVANPFARVRLARVLREFQPDVVHVRMFLTQFSPLILPLLRETPAIFHVVNYLPICPLDTKTLPDGTPCNCQPGMACHRQGCLPWLGGARTAAQYGMMRADFDVFDRVIANSKWMRDKLLADGVRCEGYVWNGVPDRPQRPPLSGPPTVGFAGRLVDLKGTHVLVRAMPLVRRAVPDARLVVAGDGPERPRLEALARKLGVADAVDFAGHLTHAEMEPRLAAAWVQAVPGLWAEPFGIVVAEAMMRGTAVVATNTGGPLEQVAEGETGLLCPPGDTAAWAAALTELLSDRGRCERFGTAGRERAMRMFTQERFVDEFVALYDQLTNQKRSAR